MALLELSANAAGSSFKRNRLKNYEVDSRKIFY